MTPLAREIVQCLEFFGPLPSGSILEKLRMRGPVMEVEMDAELRGLVKRRVLRVTDGLYAKVTE